MNAADFNATEPLLDKFVELAEKQLESAEIRQLLAELSGVVGKKRIASVTITVDVFDEDRECALPLLTTGISSSEGKEPFRT
ncbi:MAG: hypothetical protein K8T89_27110 [Planctomycetes bacterium]|nr:hypothetical protein [Planctomycetota bacterium]